MSRCFPFPPPGYILNGTRDEAGIESIKGTEEKAKKEQRRKERRREKKRERKEGESEKRSHKRRRKDGENQKFDVFRKLKDTEIDCLEKSSLTVERDLLETTSQNSCDSTLKSNEKEKQPQNNDSESIIRIRLPIRRLDSSQRATRDPVNQHPCSTSAQEHSSKPCEEKRKDRILTTSQPSRLCSICPPSSALQFLNVVENWVPNTIKRRRIELANSEDEECWWFSNEPRCKQLNSETELVSSSMSWPCARLLPEADVHALPYTVLF